MLLIRVYSEDVCVTIVGWIWCRRPAVCRWTTRSDIRLASWSTWLSTKLRRGRSAVECWWSRLLFRACARRLHGAWSVSSRRWIPVRSWAWFSGQ